MRTLIAICFLLGVPAYALAGSITVPDDHATIAGALAAAQSGDFIFVRAGNYIEQLDLVENVTLQSLDGAALTTISADGATRPIDANGVMATIDGFTITGGLAPTNGGGLRIWNSANVTVRNCIIESNTATGQGGAIAILDSFARVEACELRNNNAGSGAAILISGTGSGLADVVIDQCLFHDNTASNVGMASGSGAAIFGANTSFAVTDCMMYDNTAFALGGAVALDNATIDMSGCAIFDNSATEGGGISFHNMSDGSVTACTIYRNDSTLGGAISCTNASSPSVTRCIMSNATDGGALRCAVGSDPTFTCNNVWGNVAGNGDAICATDGGQNISVDPEFCRADPGNDRNFALQADSPCSAGSAPCSMTIGSGGVDCGVSAIETATWGRVKAIYGTLESSTE